MKKITGIIAVLLLIFLTACTQVTFVNPDDIFPGWEENQNDKNQNQDDAAALISYLQSESFMEKIAGNSTSTLKIEKGEESSDAGKASRASNDGYPLTVEFIGFTDSAENISIESGIIRIVFNGISKSDDAVTITSVDLSTIEPLEYSLSSRNGTFEMNYTGGTATGTIAVSGDSFSFSSTPTVSAPSAGIRIKVNGSTVRWNNDFGAEITNGFGGGSGTEQDPYRIYNEAQFAYISTLIGKMAESSDNYYYFDILDDLDFEEGMASPALPLFRGELDFNGHSLRGLTDAILNENTTEDQVKYAGAEYSGDGGIMYGLINDFLNGAIRNLEYYPAEFVQLSVYGNWGDTYSLMERIRGEIIFDNVNVYGSFSELGNNSSLYISQAFSADVIMTECENHADYDILTYGAPFLGGYIDRDASLTIRDCINYGDITGTQAAIFIGNSAAIISDKTISSVIIEDCENYGVVTGFEYAGYFAANAGSKKVEECEWFSTSGIASNTGNDADHIILRDQESATDVTVTLNDDNAFVITNSNPDYDAFQIIGMVYANSYINGNSNGTNGITVATDIKSAEEISGNFKKLDIMDSQSSSAGTGTINTNGYMGNETISVGDVEYYYHDSTEINGTQYIVGSAGSDYIATPTYRLYCYEKINNNNILIGMMVIEK